MNTGMQPQRILAIATRYSRFTTAIVIAIILSTVLVSSSQNALAQSPPPAGTIAGRVVLNTAGVDFPEGLEVVLTVTDPDGAVLQEIIEIPGPDGLFDFSEVEITDTDVYTIFVEYGGIARTVHIEALQSTNNIRLDIWESTDSLDSIKVGTQSTAVQYIPDREGTIGVLELIIIRNDSDRTFLLPDDALILQMPRFGVPKGFEGLRIDSDLPSGGVWNGENDFAISNAIPPGEYQIMASYTVDYVGDALDFSRPMPLGGEVVRFLVPPGMARVNGTGLSATTPSTLGDQEYNVYSGTGYAKNSEMTITLSGLKGTSSGSSNDLVTTGIPAAIGIVGLALLAYALFIRKKKSATTEASSEPTRGELVAQIASLDDLHESGEINDTEHDLQRQELMQRVANISDDAGSDQADFAPISPDTDSAASRGSIVAQIAELDESHESGEINDTEHSLRRQQLVEQATELQGNT